MENKYLYFLTLRMPTKNNSKPYITLDYVEVDKGKRMGIPYNSVKLSRTVAEGLLRCFRRFAIATERSELFPFYFTPFHYQDGGEYVISGKYLMLSDSLKKMSRIDNS